MDSAYIRAVDAIGRGMKDSTSRLVDNGDEFAYSEDLVRIVKAPEIPTDLPDAEKEAFHLIEETITALKRENRDIHGDWICNPRACRKSE